MDNLSGRRIASGLITVPLLVLLDQWTKHLAVLHLKGQEPVSLIPGILELLYVENMGAAFGMMKGMRLIFVILAPAAALLMFYMLWKLPRTSRFLPARICCIGIAAGALGNWIDRLRQSYVVDFIYFKPIDFPVFNVADIYVTCAAFLMVFLLVFFYSEEEISMIPFPGGSGRKEE